MKRFLAWVRGLRLHRAEPRQDLRVVPPVWASDDDLALLRKAGLL